MVNASSLLFFILFADDTNLFFSGKNINDLIQTVNTELEKIVMWLNVNKLSLNVKKTYYIIFSTKKKYVESSEGLCINGENIIQVDSTKFLGVMQDSKLSWSDHIFYIKGKISKGLGILSKARKIFKPETLVTLYYSFIYPYLTYCVEVWGGTSHCYTSSLFKLQKKLLELLHLQIIGLILHLCFKH